MRKILLDIKSIKFSKLSLFYSIDRTWNKMHYKGEFIVLYIPYLIEEVEIMLKNLIPYFNHKYGKEALLYFTNLVKKEAQEDN